MDHRDAWVRRSAQPNAISRVRSGKAWDTRVRGNFCGTHFSELSLLHVIPERDTTLADYKT